MVNRDMMFFLQGRSVEFLRQLYFATVRWRTNHSNVSKASTFHTVAQCLHAVPFHSFRPRQVRVT
jgi:hypothetical protein